MKEEYGGHGHRGWHGHRGVGPYGGWGYGAYGWPYNYAYPYAYSSTPDVYIVNPAETKSPIFSVSDPNAGKPAPKTSSHKEAIIVASVVLFLVILILILIHVLKK